MITSIAKLEEAERIKQAMFIETWLNPATEVINDKDDDLVNQIAESHTQIINPNPKDDPVKEISALRMSEALAGLATLRMFHEQQENGSREAVRSLNQMEREMREKQANFGTEMVIRCSLGSRGSSLVIKVFIPIFGIFQSLNSSPSVSVLTRVE
jgi:hypothetical protein